MGAKGFFRGLTERSQSASPYAGADLPKNVILPGDTEARLGIVEDFERAGFGWLWASDPEGRLIYISETSAQSTGREPIEMLGKHLTELFETDPDNPDERSERPFKFQLSARSRIVDLVVRFALGKVETRSQADLVVVLGPADPRQGGQLQGLSRHRQGHHHRIRAQADGFADGGIRFADRPRQPAPHVKAPRFAHSRLRFGKAKLRGDDDRSRPLQAGQRHARPSGRR